MKTYSTIHGMRTGIAAAPMRRASAAVGERQAEQLADAGRERAHQQQNRHRGGRDDRRFRHRRAEETEDRRQRQREQRRHRGGRQRYGQRLRPRQPGAEIASEHVQRWDADGEAAEQQRGDAPEPAQPQHGSERQRERRGRDRQHQQQRRQPVLLRHVGREPPAFTQNQVDHAQRRRQHAAQLLPRKRLHFLWFLTRFGFVWVGRRHVPTMPPRPCAPGPTTASGAIPDASGRARPPKRSGRWRDDRDGEPEHRSLAGLARDPDLAAMRLNDALGDEQAQARPALRAAGNTKELLEQSGLMVPRDPGAAVGDLEPDVRRRRGAMRPASARPPRRARARRSRCRAARNGSRWSAGWRTPAASRSGSTNTSGRPGNTSARIVTCACSDAARCGSMAMSTSAPGSVRRRCSSIVPDSIRDRFEQLVDDDLQPLAVLARREQEVALLGRERSDRLLGDQVQRHPQRRQRRAELVRHRGDQIVLQLVEAEQPRDVLEHDRRAGDGAVLAVDRRAARKQHALAFGRDGTRTASSNPFGTYAPLPASTWPRSRSISARTPGSTPAKARRRRARR